MLFAQCSRRRPLNSNTWITKRSYILRKPPFNLVVRVFENTLHVKLGDPTDVKRRVLERKKDRTKFTDALLYSLNKEDE